jgi:hypothetical protein
MAYLSTPERSAIRRGAAAALILALVALALVGSSAASARVDIMPPPGFKSCGAYGPPARRLHLYRKHVSCRQALRVQLAYERGAPATERGLDELCFKNLPGWCCGGGGGAVTCKKHHSVSLALS